MAVKDREDLSGKNLDATYKQMGSDEFRFRMRPKPPEITTRAVCLTLPTEARWQGGHVHHSSIEHYRKVRGVFGYVSMNQSGAVNWGVVWRGNEGVAFEPGCVHDIFTWPDTEFISWLVQYREHTPNEARGGEDWWPADEQFEMALANARREVERMIKEL